VLRIYDISIDDTRPVEQEDVDCLDAVRQAYGQVRRARREATDLEELLDALDAIHVTLQQSIENVRERKAPSDESA